MPFRRCAAWCGAISIRNSTPNDVAFVCSARRPPACNSRRMRSVVSSIRDRRLTAGCACTPMAVSKPLCGEWRARCDTLAARAVGRTTEVDAMKYAICAMMLTLGITAAPAQAELDMKEGYWETVVTISVGGGVFPVPAIKSSKCLTRADPIPNSQGNMRCQMLDQRVMGNDVLWRVQCRDDKATMEGSGKVTYAGERGMGGGGGRGGGRAGGRRGGGGGGGRGGRRRAGGARARGARGD